MADATYNHFNVSADILTCWYLLSKLFFLYKPFSILLTLSIIKVKWNFWMAFTWLPAKRGSIKKKYIYNLNLENKQEVICMSYQCLIALLTCKFNFLKGWIFVVILCPNCLVPRHWTATCSLADTYLVECISLKHLVSLLLGICTSVIANPVILL